MQNFYISYFKVTGVYLLSHYLLCQHGQLSMLKQWIFVISQGCYKSPAYLQCKLVVSCLFFFQGNQRGQLSNCCSIKLLIRSKAILMAFSSTIKTEYHQAVSFAFCYNHPWQKLPFYLKPWIHLYKLLYSNGIYLLILQFYFDIHFYVLIVF